MEQQVNGTHDQTRARGVLAGVGGGASRCGSGRVGVVLACMLAVTAGLPASVLGQDQPQPPPEETRTPAEMKAEAERLRQEAANREAIEQKMREAGLEPGASPAPGRAQPGATGSTPRPGAQPGATGSTPRPGAAQPGNTGSASQPGGTRNPGLNVQGGNGATGSSRGSGTRTPGPDEISLTAFSDAVEIKTFVEYVAETLGINVWGSDTLSGSVVINAPMTIKKSELLPLLDSLLESQGFMITRDDTGFYKVLPREGTPFNMGGELATTAVIATPGIRPSSLQQAMNDQFAIAGVPLTRVSYMDDLGVIVVTETPRRIKAITELVDRVLARSMEQRFIRFDLQHVAASVMRARVIELLGGPAPTAGLTPQQQQQQLAMGAQGGPLTNLADRLTVDASGNTLIFRGFENEAERVGNVIQVLDRANTLSYEQYYAGAASLQIAELAQRLGLGNVETVDSAAPTTATPGQPQFAIQNQGRGNQALQQLASQAPVGGPVMVVDVARNNIIYYGTPSQQMQLKSLIDKFDTEQELVTIRAYKILNQRADVVAEVMQGMVSGSSASGSSAFVPGSGGFFNQINNALRGGQQNTTTRGGASRAGSRGSSRNTGTNQRNTQANQGGVRFGPGLAFAGQPGSEGVDPLGGEGVFVIADTANNQVLVKAPGRQQEEFAKLINKLDQRRPQVYIEVQIVSVSASDDFRLAIELQGINAGGTGGAFQTNFGLTSIQEDTGFLEPKTVISGLAGLTAAIIKSDQVPIVINALKRDANTRILSSPQILVDDNEEAEIVSVDQQPTTQTTQTTGNPLQTSFGGYEEAGTTLFVTPSISEGGYMRLLYEVELSNFVGTGSNGVPPPKQVRNIRSNSVTIPGDSTIIVGGIKVDAESSTVVKVPLLGDIPVLGHLFRDTNKNNATTRLYVFITPRIMRDPTFQDVRLLSRGPRLESGLDPDIPAMEPAIIELYEPRASGAGAGAAPPPGTPARREEYGQERR